MKNKREGEFYSLMMNKESLLVWVELTEAKEPIAFVIIALWN